MVIILNKYIIIKNGRINFKNLIYNNILINDLVKEMRKRDIENIESIKLLIFYRNILIFRILKDPISIVMDGKIIYSNLLFKEKNILWFKKILKKYKLDIKTIKYAVCVKNKLFIIRYNN